MISCLIIHVCMQCFFTDILHLYMGVRRYSRKLCTCKMLILHGVLRTWGY